jgi:hypothetical protein
MGKRGPKTGTTWRLRNPVNIARLHFATLLEGWLACHPTRRWTVPMAVKRRLAAQAIEHVMITLKYEERYAAPTVEQVIAADSRRGPALTLRRKAADRRRT